MYINLSKIRSRLSGKEGVYCDEENYMIPSRNDPYQGFRFKVEIDSLIVAGFSEVSGFQAETQVEEFREGGNNQYVNRLPKETKYQNLILKRGLTDNDTLTNWYNDVINGKIERKMVHIFLIDIAGKASWYFIFKNAYPVKWSGSEFKADSNSIVVEAVELVHDGFDKKLIKNI
jgi:phage tail-like protein